jgi:hypothetical protein
MPAARWQKEPAAQEQVMEHRQEQKIEFNKGAIECYIRYLFEAHAASSLV